MNNNKEKLDNLRHSAAHLLAQAVLELYPDTQLTIGPTTQTGFFYDFLPTKNFKEEDLPLIEKKMHELAEKKFEIIKKEITKEEAKKLFAKNIFKLELIDAIPDDEPITLYCQGDFCDLCRGGHVENTGQIKYFKLTGLAGSYWRADKNNQALQRISGIAFFTQKELDDYLKMVEEAKLYDHRKLGKQLDLFSFHDVAPGMPFFHNKGLFIFNSLIGYIRSLIRDEYQEIKTPMIMHEDLWHTSGHYENYKENMYFTKIDDLINCVKPMNCPGGLLVYNERPHSYKELPIRMAEIGFVHRHELSGVLHGLFRVRAFHQDDAHVYCTPDQTEQEIIKILELAKTVYSKFGFKNIKMALSTKPKKSMGSDDLWEMATIALKNALKKHNVDYILQEGEGAFYGPKIDLMIQDAMGRDWQCGTVQVDFNMPINFKLEYIDSDQSRKTPVMIHRAIYGSLERFLGILIEHYKGRFPFWLAPIQARILTITDVQKDYAKKLMQELKAAGLRVELDQTGDQISGQIRQAQEDKLPWMLILGKKEQENNTVTLRYPDGKQEFGLTVQDLIGKINKELEK
ncbi:threonine--tRNA ligase [Candidatus Babeliales bacterium]|nr:threonine--tRNA ligase [Candidatus Babeliales bacterium]MCF7899442.1 threonine--tRNA ligase [Candidatus Babeliales bacterium]